MMDTVPLLAVTYERLHMSATREAAVQRLREDRQHGAAQLAAWAVEALRQEAEAVALAGGSSSGGGGREGGAAALCAFCNFGYHLACCRPAMSPIANAVAAVLEATHDELRSRCGAEGHRGGAAAIAAAAPGPIRAGSPPQTTLASTNHPQQARRL